MKEYRLAGWADVDGTHKQDEVMLVPHELIKRFGLPLESDGYKVSGEYIFADVEDNVFTVYDWKSTNLYESDLCTPAEFWHTTMQMPFSIGGKSEALQFKDWLLKQLSN